MGDESGGNVVPRAWPRNRFEMFERFEKFGGVDYRRGVGWVLCACVSDYDAGDRRAARGRGERSR